jgi:chorismate lyase
LTPNLSAPEWAIANSELTSVPDWHALTPQWSAREDDLQAGITPPKLGPAAQLLLLSDGSTTRHLQILTGQPVAVDVIDMSLIGMDCDRAAPLIEAIPGPRLRRQVWLRTASGERLAYAASWWEASHIDDYLQNRSLPIWSSLARLRTELYREIKTLQWGDCAELEVGFGYSGPFWGRYYLFWHNSKPLTLIYEIFSPKVFDYLTSA